MDRSPTNPTSSLVPCGPAIPAQVTRLLPACSATRSGDACQKFGVAPICSATITVEPTNHRSTPRVPRQQRAPTVPNCRSSIGAWIRGDAIGTVLIEAEVVSGPDACDHSTRRQLRERRELRNQYLVRDNTDAGDQGAEIHGHRRYRDRPEHRKRRERRSIRAPHRPQMVIDEHAVNAERLRLDRDRDRVRWRLAKRRQHDPNAHGRSTHAAPPERAASPAPTAPARSPRWQRRFRSSDGLGRPPPARGKHHASALKEKTGLTEPPAKHDPFRVDNGDEIREPKCDPPPELRQHP